MKIRLLALLLASVVSLLAQPARCQGRFPLPVQVAPAMLGQPQMPGHIPLPVQVVPVIHRQPQAGGRFPQPVRVAGEWLRQPRNTKSTGFKALGEIRINPPPIMDMVPADNSKEIFEPRTVPEYQRNWQARQFHWQATEFWHQPLYWDYVPWDYYGQWTHPILQPWQSGVHFFCMFPILPYKMGLDRPFDRVYTLGKHRPGDAVPRLRQRLPWQWDAITWETAAWVTAAYIFP